jgi:hypothetical protein
VVTGAKRVFAYELEQGSGCHLWTGAKIKGYASAWVPERKAQMLVHRLVYAQVFGPIPDGLQLDHLCRVKNCINPAHLEPVTGRVNTLRGIGPTAINARKTHCLRGHPFDQANTKIRTDGHRKCRTCRRKAESSRLKRRAAEARAARTT